MFARFTKPTGLKTSAFVLNARLAQQTRFLATVEPTLEGSVGRTTSLRRPRATPISHDRATFTIRVCENGGVGG